MKNIPLISLLILVFILAAPLMAATQHIVPANKEKIFRAVGESVYVECKKQAPFSRNCQVDCGNGLQYQKAKGYCHYLSAGTFLLNVSTRYRGRNIRHTAAVVISEKGKKASVASNKRAVKAIKAESVDEVAALKKSDPIIQSTTSAAIIVEENDLSVDMTKEIQSVSGVGNVATTSSKNNLQSLSADINEFEDQSTIGQVENNFGADSSIIENGFGNATLDNALNGPQNDSLNSTLNQSNQFNDQFVQQ